MTIKSDAYLPIAGMLGRFSLYTLAQGDRVVYRLSPHVTIREVCRLSPRVVCPSRLLGPASQFQAGVWLFAYPLPVFRWDQPTGTNGDCKSLSQYFIH